MEEINIFEGTTDNAPQKLNYLPGTMEILDTHLGKLISEEKLQGAGYLIARKNQVIGHRSMGYLRPQTEDRNLRTDSIMRIASITKLFTATAIMQLVEKGFIRVEQPVCEIIDEFSPALFNKITIFHLLTHTSDLKPDPGAYFEPYPEKMDWWENEDWIKDILRGHTHIDPGKEWRYCSAGYAILGEIVARASGQSFEEYVRENIFAPLEMKDTYFFTVPEDKIHRVCSREEETDQAIKEKMEDLKNRPEWATPGSAGSMYTTLTDLNKFATMIQNKGKFKDRRVLSRKSVETMTRNQLQGVADNCWENEDVERSYGLGFRVQSDFLLLTPGSVSHEGAGLSALYLDPAEELTFILFGPLNRELDFEARAVFNTINIVWSGLE